MSRNNPSLLGSVLLASLFLPATLSAQTLFPAVQRYDSGGQNAVAVAVADINGDEKLDLLVTNCADISSGICSFPSLGNIGVLLGNGDGTFQPAQTYRSGGNSAWSLAVGDVNLDGKIDVVVFNCSPEG